MKNENEALLPTERTVNYIVTIGMYTEALFVAIETRFRAQNGFLCGFSGMSHKYCNFIM